MASFMDYFKANRDKFTIGTDKYNPSGNKTKSTAVATAKPIATAKPATTPSTAQQKSNYGGVARSRPVSVATQSPASAPLSSGVGGFVYGSDKKKSKTLEDNIHLWESNPAAKAAEIARTQKVIAERKAQGLDVSAQEKHLRTTLGYAGPSNKDTGLDSITPQNTTSTPISTPTSQPNPSTKPNFQESQTQLIKDIYEKQRAAQLQKIREARDIQLQGLNKVNVQAEESAKAQRGQIASADIQASNRLRESMAQMGLLNSGDNLTAQGNLNTQRQDAMGQTNQELARVKNDVAERKALINNAAANNDFALLQQLQAQQAQDMLALGYKVNDIEYRDAVFGWQKEVDTAGLTGMLGDQRTLAGQQFDRNVFESDRDFNYQTGRDQIGDARYTDEIAYSRARDSIMDERDKRDFDEDVRRYGIETAIQKAQNAGILTNQAADNRNAAGRLELDLSKLKQDQNAKTYQSSVLIELNALKNAGATKEQVEAWLSANSGDIAANLGTDGYVELLKIAPNYYTDTTEQDATAKKAAQELRETAISMAQKDIRWGNSDTKKRKELIDEYVELLQ